MKMIPKKIRKCQRPSWDDMFLIEALYWSNRSHDTQTQCGCVIVDKDNTVLSTGYNGFVRGIDDTVLPTVRPNKYNFMIHAEHNAILNCVRQGKSTLNTTAYITGQPCTDCIQYLYQAGVVTIVYSDFNQIAMLDNQEYRDRFDLLKKLLEDAGNMIIIFKSSLRISGDHLKNTLKKFEKAQENSCQNT